VKILNLYLENFKSTIKADLKFNKRIILLEGKAGQGKTTVLEAIVYCLTDSLNEKVSEFMRLKKYPFIIKMEFEHLSNNYKIEINCKKDGNGVEKKLIINNDEGNIYKNSNATKKLAEIINPTITKYSAVSEQGKSTLLLFQKPAERLRQFKEILGIDNIAFIVGKIKEDIKTNEEKINILKAELSVLQNKSFKFQDIPEIVDNEDEIKLQISKLEIEKNKYEIENKLYNKYLNDLSVYIKAEKDIKDKELKIELNKNLWSKYEQEIKQVPEYDENLILELTKQLSTIEKEKIQYDNTLSTYENSQNKIKTLNVKIDRIKERQKEYIQVEIPVVDRENDLNKIQEDIKNYSVDHLALKKKIELVKQGKCPTCGNDFKDANLSALENTFNLLTEAIKTSKETEKSILENISLKNKAVELNSSNKIKFDSDQNLINEFTKEILDLAKILKPVEKIFNIENLKYQIIEQEKLKEEYFLIKNNNASINSKIEVIDTEIRILDAAIDELNKVVKPEIVNEPVEFDVLNFENKKKSLTILQEKKKEVERIRQYNDSIKEDKIENDKIILTKEKEQEDLYSTNRILENSKVVLDKDFSSYIIDRGCQFIKEKMNDFFRKSYGRYEVTFEQDKNSIDFFYNEKNNIPIPVVMASGFERQIISVALRIALCSLRNLGLVLFDEVDSDASSEDAISLMNNLFNEESFQQIFIISHCDEVKEIISQRNDSQNFNFYLGGITNN
jgi:DNA repair exonuclease SbcCD ATPase subunit